MGTFPVRKGGALSQTPSEPRVLVCRRCLRREGETRPIRSPALCVGLSRTARALRVLHPGGPALTRRTSHSIDPRWLWRCSSHHVAPASA
jgi:hypothetical protein